MMSKAHPVSEIITALGGPTKAAEALGISNPSVVVNWRTRNSVPAQYVAAVTRLTGIPGHELRPDIFPAPTAEAAS